jgi:hypothetical protein
MSKSSNRNPELWKALAKKLLEDPDLVQRFLDATAPRPPDEKSSENDYRGDSLTEFRIMMFEIRARLQKLLPNISDRDFDEAAIRFSALARGAVSDSELDQL